MGVTSLPVQGPVFHLLPMGASDGFSPPVTQASHRRLRIILNRQRQPRVIYILIVINFVSLPGVSIHEFSSLSACNSAIPWFENVAKFYDQQNDLYTDCIAKGAAGSPKYVLTMMPASGQAGATIMADFNNYQQCAEAMSFINSVNDQGPDVYWNGCVEK